MAHECEDCGESFETLTRLRLHECPSSAPDTDTAPTDPEAGAPSSGSSGSSPTDGETASVGELDDLLERVSTGEVDAIYGAVATYESALSRALTEDDGGETFRDVFWAYYEPVSNALDRTTRSEGWTLLGDVVEAYDPVQEDEIALATPAIANAVGRYVIRTRLTESVDAIPVASLEYLDDVAVSASDADDVAREEVHAYGWGIGHPDHPLVDRLRARATADIFSVNPNLEHAFYADQYAAIDALERLVRDESIEESIPRFGSGDMSHRRYLLDCVYGLKMDDYWPRTPRYWDWREEFDYTFEVDEAVEGRIRDLVAETGVDAELPEGWTFRDLGV